MFWKTFFIVLTAVFLTKIGNKAQFATTLFSANASINKWGVFLGSSMALILATGVGIVVGSQLEKVLSPYMLKWVAGISFITIGIWTLFAEK